MIKVNSREWWEDKTRKYVSRNDPRDRPEEAQIMADLSVGSVLEVGCCFGHFSSYLQKHQQYLGIDISAHAVNAASNNFPQHVFVHADFMRLGPYLAPIFDTIYSSQVLEHFEDPRDPLMLMRGLCRQKILFTIPRGKQSENQKKYEGHVTSWEDEKDFMKFINTLNLGSEVVFKEGQANHICGAIIL